MEPQIQPLQLVESTSLCYSNTMFLTSSLIVDSVVNSFVLLQNVSDQESSLTGIIRVVIHIAPLSEFYLSMYLSMYLSIYLSIHPSIHPFIHLSIYLWNLYSATSR